MLTLNKKILPLSLAVITATFISTHFLSEGKVSTDSQIHQQKVSNSEITLSGSIKDESSLVNTVAITGSVVNKPSQDEQVSDAEPSYFEYKDEVAIYAESFDVSEEEALRRLSRQDGLADTINAIVEKESENIAGWGISHSPDYEGWISLKGNASISAESKHILSQNKDIRIKYGALNSFDSLKKAQDLVLSINESNDPSIISDFMQGGLASIDIDMTSNELVVEINKNAQPILSGQYSEEGFATEYAAHLASVVDMPMRFTLGETLVQQTNITGGKTEEGCTLGFTVVNKDNKKGVVTAGHCANSMKGLNFVNEIIAGNIDAQFLTGKVGTTIKNTFRSNEKQYRKVRKTMSRDKMLGLMVCHWGATSYKSCGEITSINRIAPNSRNIRLDLVTVQGEKLTCQGGDSGGPWFSGQTAFGIHLGLIGSATCAFSSIQEVEKELGVNVILTPKKK